MQKPLFCRGRISVFKVFSVYCLLRLQIVQGGNLAFAIAGEHCRANIGGEGYSQFFRCRNLSLHKHRKTSALELGQQAQKQGRSETRISLPRVQKPPFAAAGDLCGRRCSNFPVQKPPFRNCLKNTIYWCCGSTNILVLAQRESIQAETGKVIVANQEVTTHKQRKFFKQNNRRYTDIYQGCKKGVIRTKKRFLHQKCERKAEKTQPCTERHYQSCVVIKECKTTIYRYRKENST